MAGKRHKEKGNRVERKIVDLHKALGLLAERIPLSGAAGGSFTGDVKINLPDGDGLLAEVKARKGATGWATIKKWLGLNDVLFLVEDCHEPLVVFSWPAYRALITNQLRIPDHDLDRPEAVRDRVGPDGGPDVFHDAQERVP